MATPTEIQAYLTHKRTRALEKSLAAFTWLEARDYLMTRILIFNGVRSDAVYKMTVEHVAKAVDIVDEQNGFKAKMVCLDDVVTKTATCHGATDVFFTMPIFKSLLEYIKTKRINPHGLPEVFLTQDPCCLKNLAINCNSQRI